MPKRYPANLGEAGRPGLPAPITRSISLEASFDKDSLVGPPEPASYLPPDCPPAGAIDGPITLYHLVERSTPAEDDFRTAREAGRYKSQDLCRRCSVSCYKTVDGAHKLRRRVKHFADHKIARAEIPSGFGRCLSTESSPGDDHWSWWPVIEAERHVIFSVFPEDQ